MYVLKGECGDYMRLIPRLPRENIALPHRTNDCSLICCGIYALARLNAQAFSRGAKSQTNWALHTPRLEPCPRIDRLVQRFLIRRAAPAQD
jgi:hypothetical protein